MATVKIIGAGVAGLSAGCYLQMNGYDTEIYEQHSIPGGLCTSWQRGEYTFDGCVHWLLGSDGASAFNRLWDELIDMSGVAFVNHDERVAIEVARNSDRYGSKVFHLYADVDRLEAYLLDLSPEDAPAIKEFTDAIRFIGRFELPPLIDKAPEVRTFVDMLGMLKFMPLLTFMNKWGKISNCSFAERLQSPFLKEAFELFFEGRDISLLVMIVQLAYYNRKCAGYPLGGSQPFARRLEEAYRQLGGKVNYGAAVAKIIVNDGKAAGLLLRNGTSVPADAVISAADWHFTVFEALDGAYTDETILALDRGEKLEIFDSAVLVSLGVGTTLADQPHLLRFPLESTLATGDGSTYDRIEAHTFSYDSTLAPNGKTVVSVTLTTRNADYWIELRKADRDRYSAEKQRIAEEVIQHLGTRLGFTREQVEEIDVATPATFLRYTGNRKGSIQGWMPLMNPLAPSPVKNKLPGLRNLYLAGQWVTPGGGLPIALLTGRNIAQVICKNDGRKLKVKRWYREVQSTGRSGTAAL